MTEFLGGVEHAVSNSVPPVVSKEELRQLSVPSDDTQQQLRSPEETRARIAHAWRVVAGKIFLGGEDEAPQPHPELLDSASQRALELLAYAWLAHEPKTPMGFTLACCANMMAEDTPADRTIIAQALDLARAAYAGTFAHS